MLGKCYLKADCYIFKLSTQTFIRMYAGARIVSSGTGQDGLTASVPLPRHATPLHPPSLATDKKGEQDNGQDMGQAWGRAPERQDGTARHGPALS